MNKFGFALCLSLLFAPAAFAQSGVTVDAHGTLLLAPGGYIAGPGIEISTGNIGFEVAANYLGYEYSDGSYYESGDGYLINARGRYYAQSPDADRLWVAGGLAIGVVETYWRDYPDYGYETNPGIVANFGVGYKFLLSERRLVIDPQLLAGVIVGAENPFIAGAGLNVGWRF